MKLVAAILLLSFSAGTYAQQKIDMLFGGEYPPYYNAGHRSGMYIDFLRAFESKHPEFSINVVVLPRRRIDDWIINQKADAFSLNSVEFMPEHSMQKYTASQVIWQTHDALISHADKPIEYTSNQSLFHKKIGVIIGNHYKQLEPDFAKDKIFRIDSYSFKGLFDSLLAKNIDGLVVNSDSLGEYLEAQKYNPNELHVSTKPLYFFDLVTLVRNDNEHFLKAINAFIIESKNNGFLFHLESKYGFADARLAKQSR